MEKQRRKKLIQRAAGLLRRISGLGIPFHVAGAGYFLILSVFPGLVVLLGLLRFTALPVESLVAFICSLIPEALDEAAAELVTSAYVNSSGRLVGISALTTLWSASRGIYGLMGGLNAVYGVGETRGWLVKRLICVAYTFAFLLVLLLTLVAQVFGNTVLTLLSGRAGGFFDRLVKLTGLRFFLLMGLQTLIFALMFRVVPNRRTGFRENLPGALLASAGWLLFSNLYSIYARHFAGLKNVYGSVYAVALSMLWLYCCLSIVFYGGALNRWLQSGEDK